MYGYYPEIFKEASDYWHGLHRIRPDNPTGAVTRSQPTPMVQPRPQGAGRDSCDRNKTAQVRSLDLGGDLVITI